MMPKVIRIVSLLAVGLTGFFLVMYITAPYGAGISADSVDYIATADNLLKHAPFIGYDGSPFLSWPPLYPLLLAALSWITGFDVLLIGRFLNAVCFGGIVTLSGIFYQRAFNNSIVWFFVGAWLGFTSYSFLALATNITSDPLFIVLVLGYALVGSVFVAKPKASILIGLGILAALSALLRWNGAIVIGSTVILALFAYRQNQKTALLNALGVGTIAVLPIALWLIGWNFRLYGTLTSKRDIAAINIHINLSDAINKIFHWLMPQKALELINPLILVLLIIALLIMINRRSNWQAFAQHLMQPTQFPWLIFTPLYFVFVIGTSVAYDHPLFHDDRYFAPLYLFTLLFVVLTISDLLISTLLSKTRYSGQTKIAHVILLGLILIWSFYPAYRLYRYMVVSRVEGDLIYNVYNTRKIRESDVITYLQENLLDQDQPIYSNIPAMVYFYTRKISQAAPLAPSFHEKNLQHLSFQYDNWPPADGAYLIWFLPNPWHVYYEPNDLREIAELSKLVVSPEGKIYFVQNYR